MSGSDRSERAAPVDWPLALIGLVLAIGIAWGVGFLGGHQSEQRQNAARTYQEKAKERAQRECVGVEPARVFECVAEKYETADDTQRSEQDLTAQQQAAWAGMSASLWSFLALAATLLGLIWIKATLDSTRETLRSYLRVESPHIVLTLGDFQYQPDGSVIFNLIASNIGGTGFVIVATSSVWLANEDDEALILNGHTHTVPVASGEAKPISPFHVARQSLISHKFLRGRFSFTSALGGDDSVGFLFRVSPEKSYPHGTTHIDMLWLRKRQAESSRN